VYLINIVVLLACIALYAWKGYRSGLWQVGFNALGMLAAYLLCYLFVPKIYPWASDIGGIPAFIGAMLVCFFVLSLLLSKLPLLLARRFLSLSSERRYFGACVGAACGVFVGLLGVWLVTFLSSVVALRQPEIARAPVAAPALVETLATRMVGGIVEMGLNASGQEEITVGVSAALVRKPRLMTRSFADVAKAPELKSLWLDPDAQGAMAEGDVQGLMVLDSFQSLVALPGMQVLMSEVLPSSGTGLESTEKLAGDMSFVWRRMRALRSDARVVAILEDEEVKGLIEKQNPLHLLANDKVKTLIDIVMEDRADGVAQASLPVDTHADGGRPLPPEGASVVYKWRDSNGKVRYTDYDNTPVGARDTAEKIEY